MSDHTSVATAVALTAGTCGAVQPKINAVLGARLGSALVASLVNFSVAFVVVIGVLVVRPGTRRQLRSVRTWRVPPWMLGAGLGGATVVLAGAVAVERIGVAIFSVAFFAGQITSGLLVDRAGVAPGGKRPITKARIQAVVLATAAVIVAQIDRHIGEFAPELVVFVVAAGAGVTFQSAFNARISLATRDPVAATALNVAVGMTALALIVAALAAFGGIEPLRWPDEPWLYTGGVLGVTVVFSLAVSTAVLGVLRPTLLMLAAQMIGAILVDWTVENEAPTFGVIAGSVLIVIAAMLRNPAAAATSDPA